MVTYRRQTGFSLIEIMAVILVIGLGLSMVSLVIHHGGPKEDVFDAIDRFIGTANFASERAVLSGEAMGLLLEPPSWQVERGQRVEDIGWRYRWVTDSSEGWQNLAALPATTLPPTIQLAVEVDKMRWEYDDQLDRATPIAAYYSSGDVTDISIVFSDTRERGFTQTIEVDENGVLVWLEAPERPQGDERGF